MILQAPENRVDSDLGAANNYLSYIPWWKQYFSLSFSRLQSCGHHQLGRGWKYNQAVQGNVADVSLCFGVHKSWCIGTEEYRELSVICSMLRVGLKVLPLGLHREHGLAQRGEEEKKIIAQVETLHLFAQPGSLEIKKAAHISSRFPWNRERTALWLMVIGCFSWILMFNTKWRRERKKKKRREENPFSTNP